jgi:hypothetical protein
MRLRVAPHPASSGSAGDGSSSCLEFRILQHIRRSSSGLPHSFAPPVVPIDESPGCPGFCIFRPCRRWIFELPRISHPSAHPAHKLASCPAALLLRVRQPMQSPGSPRFLHLPAVPATDQRVAPRLASFGASGADALGYPSALLIQLRLPVGLRVSPLSAPSGFALGLILRVAPNPLSLGAG